MMSPIKSCDSLVYYGSTYRIESFARCHNYIDLYFASLLKRKQINKPPNARIHENADAETPAIWRAPMKRVLEVKLSVIE